MIASRLQGLDSTCWCTKSQSKEWTGEGDHRMLDVWLYDDMISEESIRVCRVCFLPARAGLCIRHRANQHVCWYPRLLSAWTYSLFTSFSVDIFTLYRIRKRTLSRRYYVTSRDRQRRQSPLAGMKVLILVSSFNFYSTNLQENFSSCSHTARRTSSSHFLNINYR